MMRHLVAEATRPVLNGLVGTPRHPASKSVCRQSVRLSGHTLSKVLGTIERTTRVKVTDAYVDKGYRGHDLRR